MAADNHLLLRMQQAGNADLHIESRQRRWPPLPALNEEVITRNLRAKALQVARHLLCPIGREAIVALVRHIASLAPLKIGGQVGQLSVNIERVHHWKISGSGRS